MASTSRLQIIVLNLLEFGHGVLLPTESLLICSLTRHLHSQLFQEFFDFVLSFRDSCKQDRAVAHMKIQVIVPANI